MKLPDTLVEKLEKDSISSHWYKLGFLSGQLEEMNNYKPLSSKNWWIIFLLGIFWGLLIVMLVIKLI